MAGIQLTGLVNGLDTQSIISQLMSVERAPRTGISLEQAAATRRQTLLSDMGRQVTGVRNALEDLGSVTTWLDTQAVSSSDDSKVSASRTSGAAPGAYDVAVTALAAAARHTYDYAPPASDGPLTIYNKDGSVRTSVDLKAGASIDDAVAAINNKTDADLYAVNVNGDLVLSAKKTGTVSDFTVNGAGADLTYVHGVDAQYSINGVDQPPSSSNTIANALPGVQFTLKAKTGSSPVGVSVSGPGPDKDAIVSKVKAFITAYNAMVSTARTDLEEKKVPTATTSSDASKGVLFGDTGLSGMLTSLRNTVSEPIAGLTGLKELSDIGITTGAPNTGTTVNADSVDGKLTLDETKLRAALDSNPLGVKQLLGGDTATKGFAQVFGKVLDPFEGSGGVLDQRVTEAGKDLARIKDKLDTFDARMDAKEAFYNKQFTALTTALSQSQSVGNSLASYISQLG